MPKKRITKDDQPLFETGELVCTIVVFATVRQDYMLACLERHCRGDYGNVPKSGIIDNEIALEEGMSILSAYPLDPTKPCRGYGENTLWVITHGTRLSTTFMLPEEH